VKRPVSLRDFMKGGKPNLKRQEGLAFKNEEFSP
jgi:hypothetical protein